MPLLHGVQREQCEGLRIQPTQPAEKQPQVQPIERLTKFSAQQVGFTEPAGEKIETVLTLAPGNGASIGGLKVIAESGWIAARPSGTDNIYKIYADSFRT